MKTRPGELLLVGLAALALSDGCGGANDVAGPETGCHWEDGRFTEKNGPCQPCEGLRDDFANKNKPCHPD